MTPEINQREQKLGAALRELASCSGQEASPELAANLKDAFRRHHARRRRVFRVRMALVCLCLAAVGLFLLKKTPVTNSPNTTTAVQPIPPQGVLPPVEVSASPLSHPTTSKRHSANRKPAVNADKFWALPSFDLVPSRDQLRVVRMEMRAEDLRLLGAPVSDVIARHRVTADLVVGRDGTPYAVRLVQANF